ncbi:MAG TPA: AAA family ATPase, partial [Candidatus Wallbacteria bacterium]|nr:AAA family ATPase [Candidatus Wallbacteria bacterium]
VIILTSNIAGAWLYENSEKPLSERSEYAMNELKRYFRPEFINRLDEIIVFNSLDRESMKNIVKLRLAELGGLVSEKNIKLEFTDGVIKHIVDTGFSPQFGARPVNRVIEKSIKGPLAMKILSREIIEGMNVKCLMSGDEIKFKSFGTEVALKA